MKLKGLLGGIKDGKWIKTAQTAKSLDGQTEFVLIGENGIEEGGVSVGVKFEPEVPCEEFYRMEFDLNIDLGIAVGSNAEWNLVPRTPQKLENDSKVYNQIVKTFLAKKGLSKTTVKIDQIYKIDIDGDNQDEVVIAATYYKQGLSPSANAGDYSFVMVRKVVGKKVEEMILDGNFIKKRIEFGAPNEYEISGLADLNGDGKMEVVVHGAYYEGTFSTVYELIGNKFIKVLETGCGV